MRLESPTLEQCQIVRSWRNESLNTLRTCYPLTPEQQAQFFKDVICNRNSNHRYWSIWDEKKDYFVGFGGLTFIEWENRQTEISLIINPELRGKGYGKKAVLLLLEQAFNHLNLELVYGECYLCNDSGVGFWKRIVELCGGQQTEYRKGKYWNGKHCDTMYFDITKDEFNKKNT